MLRDCDPGTQIDVSRCLVASRQRQRATLPSFDRLNGDQNGLDGIRTARTTRSPASRRPPEWAHRICSGLATNEPYALQVILARCLQAADNALTLGRFGLSAKAGWKDSRRYFLSGRRPRGLHLRRRAQIDHSHGCVRLVLGRLEPVI